ncbi:MAG: hypothetical protein RM022_031185 [Nostoc sp. EfeVER01]|uniref:hypothetical protein n=1 Tax=Nostoc sp. EfeVER01 TaxID=3075406 RepID=UPI002AD3AFF4|nr:hypothetical protein [Nostoc sp. EfeVER01]MDZ7945678.1 hypothetical protein [Nostoc sp. EfeVER01]
MASLRDATRTPAAGIAHGFLGMQMFYNPSKASIVGIFLSSAFCLTPTKITKSCQEP